MTTHRILTGDAMAGMATLPDASVHMAVTSPPYWSQRSYLGGLAEIGQEESPEEWCARLVVVFREVRRVLRNDGTLWLNCGDAYTGSGKAAMADGSQAAGAKQGTNGGSVALGVDVVKGKRMARGSGRWGGGDVGAPGLKPKDLVGLPWLLAFALRADGWWLRSEITWCKTASMPESVEDRPSSATEKVFLFARAARYYYDSEAVKEPLAEGSASRYAYAFGGKKAEHLLATDNQTMMAGIRGVPSGRNQRNYWVLGPEPSDLPHYAMYPTEIPRRAILAGSSEAGCCPACLAPWVRVVERNGRATQPGTGKAGQDGWLRHDMGHGRAGMFEASSRTLGWRPGCTCDAGAPVPATVLDPFLGSGTTAIVAKRLGRSSIGCELNPAYVAMAEARLMAEPEPMPMGDAIAAPPEPEQPPLMEMEA